MAQYENPWRNVYEARPYARVHTPAGWKRNADLVVGDVVSTPDGKNAQVLGV